MRNAGDLTSFLNELQRQAELARLALPGAVAPVYGALAPTDAALQDAALLLRLQAREAEAGRHQLRANPSASG